MNKKLYMLASAVVLLTGMAMVGVSYLGGDIRLSIGQSTENEASNNTVEITINNGEVTSSSQNVQFTDGKVIVSAGGKYEISGSSKGLVIEVSDQVKDDVTLILNNAELGSISMQSTGTNILQLADNTTNALSGAEFGVTATNVTVNGNGSLTMSDISQYGIFATHDLVIESDTLSISSQGSGLGTLHDTDPAQANLTINGGDITIESNEAEGYAGVVVGNQFIMNNGTLSVTKSYEGIVGKYVTLNGGTAKLVSTDDGVVSKDPFYEEGAVSDVNIVINGGNLEILASGDALDSNGDLTVNGGELILESQSQSDGALAVEGNSQLTGGRIWALGSVTGAQVFTSASQNYLSGELYGEQGETITITDMAGQTVASYTTTVAFSYMLYTSETLETGNIYTVTTSGGQSIQLVATNQAY